MARTARGPQAIGHALALEDGASVPAIGVAGSSTSSLVRRLLRSGGSVSSPVMASGLRVRDQSAGRRRATTTALRTTCSSLLTSRERLRPSSVPVSGLPPDVSPSAARCRSRRGAARSTSIPFCEERNAPCASGLHGPPDRLRNGVVSPRPCRGCSVAGRRAQVRRIRRVARPSGRSRS